MITNSSLQARLLVFVFSLLATFVLLHNRRDASGQEPDVPVGAELIEALMKEPPPAQTPKVDDKPFDIDMLSLLMRGGIFMIPIGLMSLMVVTLAVERTLCLRRKRIIPKKFVAKLEDLCDPIDRFNPSAALAICRDSSSPAAAVVEAMLMRTGQPLAEIEHAAMETVQREAADYAAPIRWLSFAASAAPLMGLLGTVWGMIISFHASTMVASDKNRSLQLSEGISVAFVNTLAGLVVAIPSAVMAQYLENRLSKLFHAIERFTFDLAPGLSRFTGRMRLDPDGTLRPMTVSAPTTTANPPPAPPQPLSPTMVSQSKPVVPSTNPAGRMKR